MSRLQKYLLTEKFNLKYPIDNIYSGSESFSGRFTVDNTQFSLHAESFNFDDSFDIEYTPGLEFLEDSRGYEVWYIDFADAGAGSWGITGKMGTKAMSVFSGVLTLMNEFIKKKKPKVFYFSAKESSRVKLYDAMTKLMIKKIPGYKVKKVNTPNKNTYTFYK